MSKLYMKSTQHFACCEMKTAGVSADDFVAAPRGRQRKNDLKLKFGFQVNVGSDSCEEIKN